MSLSSHVLDTGPGPARPGVRSAGTGWRTAAVGAGRRRRSPTTTAGSRLGPGPRPRRGHAPPGVRHRRLLRGQGRETFYPEVVVVFEVADADAHHHVPLLLSPFAYSTYRGRADHGDRAGGQPVRQGRDPADAGRPGPERHELHDLNVSVALAGDLDRHPPDRRQRRGAADRHPEEHRLRVRPRARRRPDRGVRGAAGPALRRRRSPVHGAPGSTSRSTPGAGSGPTTRSPVRRARCARRR